jgi:hypothetical protein
MSEVALLPLRFQIGARTLAAVPRRLTRVPLSLADVLSGRVPSLPSAGAEGDGYLVTSLPADQLGAFAATGLLVRVRQSYTRYHVDLSTGYEAWEAGLSAATRAGHKRKAKKLATATITRYASPDEIAAFHPLARRVSALTYQERLLDAGLPADPTSLLQLAAAGRVRAWLLSIDGSPVAYLCCTAEGDTLRYDYVGHDAAASALSPGAVLQVAALRDLFDEGRFRWFDFTEGEGQHKRSLSTGGIACVDLLLLRPTLANRVVLAALGGFDRTVALAKAAARHPSLARIARRVRR